MRDARIFGAATVGAVLALAPVERGLAAGGQEFELRRRQSLERVSGSVLTEDATPLPPAPGPRRGPGGREARA